MESNLVTCLGFSTKQAFNAKWFSVQCSVKIYFTEVSAHSIYLISRVESEGERWFFSVLPVTLALYSVLRRVTPTLMRAKIICLEPLFSENCLSTVQQVDFKILSTSTNKNFLHSLRNFFVNREAKIL